MATIQTHFLSVCQSLAKTAREMDYSNNQSHRRQETLRESVQRRSALSACRGTPANPDRAQSPFTTWLPVQPRLTPASSGSSEPFDGELGLAPRNTMPPPAASSINTVVNTSPLTPGPVYPFDEWTESLEYWPASPNTNVADEFQRDPWG
jgi:hypothetical protein